MRQRRMIVADAGGLTVGADKNCNGARNSGYGLPSKWVRPTTMKKHYMICVDNQGYEASLEKRKLYQVLSDKEAGQNHQIRVIDESGEDYLYPEGYFAPVRLPSETKQRLELTAA